MAFIYRTAHSMELSPVALGSAVPLTADVPVTLGRSNYNVHDTRISRQHATARLSHQGATQSITITALKPVYVEHSGSDTTQLSQGQTCQVSVEGMICKARLNCPNGAPSNAMALSCKLVSPEPVQDTIYSVTCRS